MEEGRHSATAENAAIMRALHQRTARPRVLDDPVAGQLVDPDGAAWQARVEFLRGLPEASRARTTHYVLRSRYAEDCLAEAVARGQEQYVILGAGLDTFAYRQPSWARTLRIFEADHPATQQWKRGRLRDAGMAIPENTRLAPVDFEKTTLMDALREAGFDHTAPAFFSMLGVSQYLTEEALDETLAIVRALPPSSEIVFSFVVPDELLPPDEAALATRFTTRFAAIGEPWLTRLSPDRLRTKLQAMGFSEIFHLLPEDANRAYFHERQDDLVASLMEQMMRAVV